MTKDDLVEMGKIMYLRSRKYTSKQNEMARRVILCAFLLLAATLQAQVRTCTSLNDDWCFHNGDISAEELFKDIDQVKSWRMVDIPHDFQIEQPWVAPEENEKVNTNDPAANIKSRLSARGFKEMGSGWYVKSITPEKGLKEKRILLDFEGIMYYGDVYLNGALIGGTDYGYLGFEFDITDKILWNQEDVIAVHAYTGNPNNSRWYTGGGLYRNVRLISTPKQLYFTRHPLRISTTDNKVVNIQAEVANYTKNDNIRLQAFILQQDGKKVYEITENVRFHRRYRTNELALSPILLENPIFGTVTIHTSTRQLSKFLMRKAILSTVSVSALAFGLLR